MMIYNRPATTDDVLQAQVKDALQHYHDLAYLGTGPLTRLHLVRSRTPSDDNRDLMATGQVVQSLLDELLDQLAGDDGKGTTSMPRIRTHRALMKTYCHKVKPQQVYRQLSISRAQYYRDLDEGIARLSQLLHKWELRSQTELGETPNHFAPSWRERLPPSTCTRLFGAEAPLSQVQAALGNRDHQWLVAIDGVGGIGKTTLARAAAEKMMAEGCFTDLVWATAQTEIFTWGTIRPSGREALTVEGLLDVIAQQLGQTQLHPWPTVKKRQALQAILHRQAALIVVDNLETAVDYQAIADELWALTQPTKVLITSRHRLDIFDPVTSVHLNALSYETTVALIRYRALEKGVTALVKAEEDSLRAIYEATGGSPLALKLILGQATVHPLDRILADLSQATGMTEELYRFIYWASWETLSPQGRQLFLSLPLLAITGGPWEALVAISGLNEDAAATAVAELARLSLLEVDPGPPKHYSIHQLTRQFVLSELVNANEDFAAL